MTSRHTLGADVRRSVEELLAPVDDDLAAQYPGDRAEPQPVHTVYVSAADVDEQTPRSWGDEALRIADAS